MAEIINKIAAAENFVSQITADLIEAFPNFSEVETTENGKRLYLTDSTYLEVLNDGTKLEIKGANLYYTWTLYSYSSQAVTAYMIIKSETGDIIFRAENNSVYLTHAGNNIKFAIVACKNARTGADEWCVTVTDIISNANQGNGYRINELLSADRSSNNISSIGSGGINNKITIATDIADCYSDCVAKNAKICLARQANNFGNVMIGGKKYFDCLGLLLLDE